MPVPDLYNQMQQYSGAQEAPTPPPTPEDYMGEAVAPDPSSYENPVLGMDQRIVEDEPLVMGGGMGMEASVAPMSSELPQGPEADMDPTMKEDLHDMLAQRAKARAVRSEYFQTKAREMAGKYF